LEFIFGGKKVKKFASVGVFLCVVSMFLCSQIVEDKDIPADMKAILSEKTLVVAMTATDQPPFYFINDEGNLVGFDVDIARKMAKELGITRLVINREAKSFNDVVSMVASGKADLAISKLSRTLMRARYVKFSTPYIVLTQGLLFNRLQLARYTSEENVRSFIRGFEGKIGVIQSSSYVNYAKENFPKAQIVEYPTWDAVVAAVVAGDVLAAYRDDLEIRKIMDSLPNSALTLKPMYFTDLTDPIAIAVKSDNTQLLSWVNTFLEIQAYNLTSDELIKKYLIK